MSRLNTLLAADSNGLKSERVDMNDSESERDVATAILGYLEENAEASDTLEGIAEWWLMRQRVTVEVDTLRKVLRLLTARGVLEKIGANDNPRYRLKCRTH